MIDPVELVRDPSLSGSAATAEAKSGIASVGSYSEPVIVPGDSGSVSSGGPIHGGGAVPQSPAQSNPSSVDSSPAQGPMAAATPNPHAFIPQPPQGVDLLDAQLYPSVRQRSNNDFVSSEDDDETEPSSSATATGNTTAVGDQHDHPNSKATSTFGRLIEISKQRLNPGERKRGNGTDDEDDENVLKNALIYGYLQKLGRNGKWQTRWFETDGECLTYYKSSKRIKLLATLDLAKVGSISINYPDTSGTTFTISISQRSYHLRADSKAACKDWVITLNRVKEARMQEGNVKLSNKPIDLLDDFTPRVVVVANRQRTRAVDEGEIENWGENLAGWNENPANNQSAVLLARWKKPGHSLKRLANKLVRWARSIRKNGCFDAENQVVVLDRHLHPPGHDFESPTKAVASSSATESPDLIKLNTETPDLIKLNTETAPQAAAGVTGTSDEDDGVRHLS